MKRYNCPVCNKELIRLEPLKNNVYEFWCDDCDIDIVITKNKEYMKNIKSVALCIAEILHNCGFDDITDSSGYYVVREFKDGTDRAVDVYKSTLGGKPHYVIYCSYEDGDFNYRYTEDLSIEQLMNELEEFCKA